MDKYMKKSDVIAYIRKEAEEAQDLFEECGGEWGIVYDAYKALADDFAESDDRVETTLIGIDFADGADYIGRETVVKHLDDCMDTLWKPEIVALKCFVEGVPSADVAPVRHGKWIPFHAEFAGDIQYCSVCEIGFSARTDYCPHCGAVMDGWRKEGAENE